MPFRARKVKSPKVYVWDSGLFHTLQGIRGVEDLLANPKLGASWEGFAVEQALAQFPGEDAYFYAIHGGSDLDLYLPGLQLGFEMKRSDVPKPSRSMRIAMEDLRLKGLFVIYPGVRRYSMGEGIEAVPLTQVSELAAGV